MKRYPCGCAVLGEPEQQYGRNVIKESLEDLETLQETVQRATLRSALKATKGTGPCTFCSPTVPVAQQRGPYTRLQNEAGVGVSVDLCRGCVIQMRVETYEPVR